MVAGASRGLGYAVARALAAEGTQVSIASRDAAAIAAAADRIARETGGAVLGVAADVRRRDALENWHRRTLERFGGLDLLMTNSGGPPPGKVETLEDADWQAAFELLVLSAIRLVRLAVPSMTARGGGSILLSTSSTVKQPIDNLDLSNVLRLSVAGLTKTLANELADRKIRVNQLLPGRIATDRVRELDEANTKRLGIPFAEYQKQAMAQTPMGRAGRPEEFANAAVFLLSDAASYITGASLQVDGGVIRAAI